MGNWYDDNNEFAPWEKIMSLKTVETKQCPLCRQKVVIEDYASVISECDNRFKEPCDKCRYRINNEDEYPCRWCVHR